MTQEYLNSRVIGILNDFMGFLTARDKLLMLSSYNDASPAVEAIQEFLKQRNIADAPPDFDWKYQCERIIAPPVIKDCEHCKFKTSYHSEGYVEGGQELIWICTAETPDEEDGFSKLIEVGDGEHPDCLCFRGKVK